MKVRAQVAKVLNLDKCIGCHTCSVTCKNVWTSRKGVEYAWFNNVETRPGRGYPVNWENQEKYNGGWELKKGKLKPKQGGKLSILSKIFANPNMPEVKDYYEPFGYEYSKLHNSKESKNTPVARPVSAITGDYTEIKNGPNWDDQLGGEFITRSEDKNFDHISKEIYQEFERTFMIYLPRLCEHCLNPTCVASCPNSAIYKREEDGIVLIDQQKCRGFRMCVSGCPYKKIYFNWDSGKSEKCTFCFPRIEAGMPTVCSETCVGRIRYLGVVLYDADKIEEVAKTTNPEDLYEAQLSIFLNPFDEEVIKAAKKEGINDTWLEAAKNSPVYKMAIDWKVAFPLHPEYRTLPMVWYIPPLSPIYKEIGEEDANNIIAKVKELRIPIKYLANMLTAGKEQYIEEALAKMMAMRAFMRAKTIEEVSIDKNMLKEVGLTATQIEDMYKIMAIANFEDRFVIPSAARESMAEDIFDIRSSCGFSSGGGCGGNSTKQHAGKNYFGGK